MTIESIGNANQSFEFKIDGKEIEDLYLDSFHGKEGMSRLFSFELVLYSEDLSLGPKDFLNKEISFCVKQEDSPQWYNGVVQRFQYGGFIAAEIVEYRITVVPKMWILTKNRKYQIFTEKKASDIISSILSENGISGSSIATTNTVHEKCTQYGESDFHFISRLMEQEGLFYYFNHSNGSHDLVIEQGKGWQGGSPMKPSIDQFYSVKPQYELRSHETKAMAYDFVKDVKLIEKKSPSKDSDVKKHGAGELQEYTGISNKSILNDYADARMSTEESQYAKASFTTFDSSIRMGNVIQCNDFPSLDSSDACSLIDSDWIPIELETHAFEQNRISNIEENKTFQEKGEFFIREMNSGAKELDRVFGDLELDSPYLLKAENFVDLCSKNTREFTPFFNRMHCLRKGANLTPPRITTKPVISGVQTARVVDHSDPDPDKIGGRIRVQFFWHEKEDSCFARLTQPIAGSGWGFMAMPRVGQDVVVAFEQGDPDQPVIVGSVYNGKNHPSYPETEDWSKTYFRDEKGSEILFDEEGPDGALLSLKAIEYLKREVMKDMKSEIHGDKKETIDGERTTKITRDDTLEITGDHTTKVTQNEKLDALQIEITAKTTIKLKAGGSSIEIGPGGVTIKGPVINLNP
ncbi:MAG: hypothetical protein COA78_02585 [Blastopirellula sp.]|nr:MAG: hypothetical protein COA78_02585 [Blastopirellula sp.]